MIIWIWICRCVTGIVLASTVRWTRWSLWGSTWGSASRHIGGGIVVTWAGGILGRRDSLFAHRGWGYVRVIANRPKNLNFKKSSAFHNSSSNSIFTYLMGPFLKEFNMFFEVMPLFDSNCFWMLIELLRPLDADPALCWCPLRIRLWLVFI